MITKQRKLFYFVGQEAFPSLEEAQKCDLKKLLPPDFTGIDGARDIPDSVVDWMLENAAAITCILTTTPRSRARARKANGATRQRKPKTTTPEAPDTTL